MPKAPIESFWGALWLELWLFLCLDGRMSSNRVGTHTGGRKFNLLPKEPIESFWDALWLGIQPFLCSIEECRRIVIWQAQTIEN